VSEESVINTVTQSCSTNICHKS